MLKSNINPLNNHLATPKPALQGESLIKCLSSGVPKSGWLPGGVLTGILPILNIVPVFKLCRKPENCMILKVSNNWMVALKQYSDQVCMTLNWAGKIICLIIMSLIFASVIVIHSLMYLWN